MGEQKYRSMNLKIKADSTFKYLQVFNGILELTQKELQVLAEFINVGDLEDLCSVETKQIVAKNIGLKDFNTLNNYIKRLKDKNAMVLVNKPGKNAYTIPKFLKPQPGVSITIDYA